MVRRTSSVYDDGPYEPVIDETVTIMDADIEEVYGRCLEYVKSIKALVLEEEQSSYIKARHYVRTGTIIGPMPSDSIDLVILNIHLSQEKTPFPELFPDPPNIKVEIKIPREDFTKTNVRLQRYVRWYKVVEGLWNHLGVELDKETRRRYYPERHLQITIKVNMNIFYLNLIMIIGISVMIFHLILTNQINVPQFIALLSFLLLGGVIILRPTFNVANGLKIIQRELYPDVTDS